MSVKQAAFVRLQPQSVRRQVAREIENKIFSGELAIGERLPPERELSEALGVSRSLVNLAVLDLESMGFLRIVPRQGTFVADYKAQCTPQMLLSLMTHGSEGASAELFRGMMETPPPAGGRVRAPRRRPRERGRPCQAGSGAVRDALFLRPPPSFPPRTSAFTARSWRPPATSYTP